MPKNLKAGARDYVRALRTADRCCPAHGKKEAAAVQAAIGELVAQAWTVRALFTEAEAEDVGVDGRQVSGPLLELENKLGAMQREAEAVRQHLQLLRRAQAEFAEARTRILAHLEAQGWELPTEEP